jgi:hypothetical protein
LKDLERKTIKNISEEEEKDGKLWIASIVTPYIGVYRGMDCLQCVFSPVSSCEQIPTLHLFK